MTPATPASPEPKAKVSALTRATSMPQAAAIFGLRMIARTWMPIDVRYMISQVTRGKHRGHDDDEGAIAVDLRTAEHETFPAATAGTLTF